MDKPVRVHRRRFRIMLIIAAFAMALLLAACTPDPDGLVQSDSAPDPSPAAEATPEPTPTTEPTAIPESTPAPEPTATPEPTPAAEPTQTPEPTATPEPTPAPEPVDAAHPVACDVTEPVVDDDLQHLLEERIAEYGYTDGFSVVVQEVTTGARAEVNADQSYYGASLYKTAVMYEAMRQVEAEKLSLDQYVTIDDFYASQDLGTLGAMGWGVGSEITLLEAVEASIIISDNATAFLLGDLVGWAQLDITLNELGLTDTEFAVGTLSTTAHDQTLILEAIACADEISEESSQMMLDFLADQQVNNRLPVYLPEDAVVGHKTGNWEDANHDAGIVYGPDATYIIAVLTQHPGADEAIAQLSRDVYEFFHPDAPVDEAIPDDEILEDPILDDPILNDEQDEGDEVEEHEPPRAQ